MRVFESEHPVTYKGVESSFAPRQSRDAGRRDGVHVGRPVGAPPRSSHFIRWGWYT